MVIRNGQCKWSLNQNILGTSVEARHDAAAVQTLLNAAGNSMDLELERRLDSSDDVTVTSGDPRWRQRADERKVNGATNRLNLVDIKQVIGDIAANVENRE